MKGVRRTIRRRRKEGKTDYKARMGFLKSEKPRIVVRKTNRYITGQIIVANIAQDKVVSSVSSKDLLSKGWPKELSGSLKSIPASYLTGIMLGKKSKEVKEAVFDIGLYRNVKNSRVYAFLNGLVDSGFNIKHDKKVFPGEKILLGNEKTGNLVNKIKESLN